MRLERREDIEAKFRDNAQRTITAEDAQQLLETVAALEALPDVAGLMHLATA